MSINEIATKIMNTTLSQPDVDSSRTIFIVGSKNVGKSTLINSFLDKSEPPRETVVLEYSFCKRSNPKQGIEKIICHIWEYGGKVGKLEILKNVLTSVPVHGNYFYCVMVDISKIKSIWNTLESCIQAMSQTYLSESSPELIIICGKYDLFKNYDSEIKKFICTTLRSVALLNKAHLLFYSSKEPQLVKRAKEMFHNIGFGHGIPFKDKNTSFTKPLVIPKGSDNWESIGISATTLEQVKMRHVSRIPPDPEDLPEGNAAGRQRTHPEPVLDSLIALKYDEQRRLESLDTYF